MCIWVKPFTFNMLWPLFTSCILHSLKYIERNVTQCFAIILQCSSKFSHFLNYQHLYMNWIIHFEVIETIIQMLHIALISIYWNTHNNWMLYIYTWICKWIFSHLLNYQHLHMSWIVHFQCVESIIHKLHFAFNIIFWNGCIKIR